MDLRTHRILEGTQPNGTSGLKLGRSQIQVSLMERGYILPKENERNRIAEIFKVNPDAIEFPKLEDSTLNGQPDAPKVSANDPL